MIVNQAAIREVFHSFNTVFNMTYAETPVQHPKIAMEVPSDAKDETYAWLGSLSSMREWIGDRHLKSLSAHTYTIQNRTFENTVALPRENVEDDQIGVFRPVVQDLAEAAKQLPDRLVFGLLLNAFEGLCYDSQPFISDRHPHLFGTKKGVQSNKGTDRLSPDSYATARASMMCLTNDEEEPLYLVPDLLVVSPQKEAAAKRILKAEKIDGDTNIHRDTAEVMVVPQLSKAPEAWFLLCTSKSIKPFIFQNRRKPAFISKDQLQDDDVFYSNRFVYGVDMRCNAGYGLWQLAYGSDGTTGSEE